MVMTQSGKMVDGTKDPSGVTQQPQSPNVRRFRCFDLKASLFVVACLLTTAFGKPGNTCNSETQFSIKYGDGSTTCEDCESCPPGQTLSIKCGKQISPSTMVICEPCKLGMSFSSKHGTSVCTPCSSCSKDQVVLQNCTLTQDIKCDKRCYGNDRYYDNDKGDCFPCTKCCNDELDVVENECKEKLGTSSNMICSFHSSINRCVKSTPFPLEPTTTMHQSTITDDYTTPSQGSKHEHTVSTAAQPSYHFSQTKATKHRNLRTPISVSMAVLVALLIAGFLYIRKARQTANYLWCYNCDTETGIPDSGSHHKPTRGNLDMVEEGLEMSDKLNHHILSTESMEPLLAERDPEMLSCICEMDTKREWAQEKLAAVDAYFTPCMLETMSEELAEPLPKEVDSGVMPRSSEMATKKDSKPLNSLLERESDLRKICNCLDTPMPGVGYYPAVAQYYGYDYYQRVSVFEKQRGGPSRALFESLQAINPELTVAEFASVVRKETNRNDVGKLLDEYDLK